jgi:hypothetical protein
MAMREVLRSIGAGAGTGTAVVALYLMAEEFLRREHVVAVRTLGYHNLLVLFLVWLCVATSRAWREYAE